MRILLPDLPEPLRAHVERLIAASLSCVCIAADERGRLVDHYGDTARLGLALPAAGSELADVFPFVADLDLSSHQEIPGLQLDNKRAVDLHVLPGEPVWLVLMDCSEIVDKTRGLQQAANESRLASMEQRRLMEALIDSKAELALRKQEAEEGNRRKSDFIGAMAHEFRTPLTSVLGYSQLLEERVGSDSSVVTYLAAIDRAARHLLSLVENNLDQARLEAGSMVIHRVDAEVRQMVDDLTVIMAPLAADKGLSFGAYVEQDVPGTLWLDDVRLRQVLVNLLSNAIKFTDAGEVSLAVDWRDGNLICTVQDTGPGIPAPARASIFEAFQRLEHTVPKPGAGLGLNISMRLMRLMGGEILLESEPGQGSEFTARLPARRGRLLERKKDLDDLGTRLARRARESVTILVAEDNPDIMLLLETFLVQSGYELIKASNGRQAVEKALSHSPPLVIMDMNMPDLDGMQAVRLLRQAGFEGRVIALTATRGSEYRQAALAAGFDEYLSKPVQMPHLLSTLERLREHK